MSAKLTRIEQETVFLYNQEEKLAHVSTCDPKLIRKIDSLTLKTDVITKVSEREGYAEYTLPKGCIKIKIPRRLDEKQRLEIGKRLNEAREKKQKEGT